MLSRLAVGLIGWLLIAASSPSHALEWSAQQAAIYGAAAIFRRRRSA